MNSSQSQITILHELKIVSLLLCCFHLGNALHKTTFILLLQYFTVECFTPQVGKILPIQVVLRLTIYVLCSRKFQITSN